MKRIKEFFLLKDDIFFDMLFKLVDCAHKCSQEFEQFIKDFETLDAGQKGVRLRTLGAYEKDGDVLVRAISEELYRNFITPIDREDIHELASNLDNTIDLMEDVAKKFVYYRVDVPPQAMKVQARIITAQIKELRQAIESLKSAKHMKSQYQRVFDLEDEADMVYENAMTELFDPSNELAESPLLVIKLKDIYDELEDVTDVNQHLAAIIEAVVIKHV